MRIKAYTVIGDEAEMDIINNWVPAYLNLYELGMFFKEKIRSL